jgi:hypothetical protein
MKKFLLLILLLSGIKYAHEQSAHLKFNHFTVTDDLPERVIRFIKQDNQCYVWAGAQTAEGIGLSLTYDMMVKGHRGTIEVNTKEGEFTEFTIYLPL